MRRLAFSFLALVLTAAVPALAQEEPPARVGRVSFVSGQLGFHTAGETAWSAAAVNYPVATGGSFWADPQSRAELRVGSRTIDLAGNSQLDITKLNQQVMQLGLPQGRINLNVRTLLEGESIEVDLPRGAVWLLQPGIYDIDAGTADDPARIAVFEGSARFVGGTVEVAMKAGDTAVISGKETLTAAVEHATPDAFAKWCRSRDYREQRLASPYYISPQMTGYEELDEYGGWRSSAQYGEVWYPRSVPSGWVPYREGQWVWVEPWGWNWVDAEPWGFAPFHYGRWAQIDDQWGWIPGEFAPQPVYAPALVGFLGDGDAGYWQTADAGPAVGWFPLGPGEIYWPSYSRDPGYIRNLNMTSVAAATIAQIASAAGRSTDPPPQVRQQNFANRTAATVVPAQVFANAGKVAPAALHLPAQTVQQAPVSLRPPQVAPPSARAPGAPGVPGSPGIAHAPGAPGGPEAPGGLGAPGIAHAPGAPGAPGLPVAPGAPGGPGAPGIAHAPGAPGAPGGPGASGAPGVAHAPAAPGAPGLTHAPGGPGAPGGPPAVAHATPPRPAAPPQAAHVPPAMRAPPQAAHAPAAMRAPPQMGPPPQAAYAPPAMRAPPQMGPPPQAAYAPPAMRAPPEMGPPPQAMRAPPPQAAPAPRPPPAPSPQAAPAPRPAPPPQAAPAPQVARAPPPQAAPHPAAPPAPPRGGPPAPPKGGPPKPGEPPHP